MGVGGEGGRSIMMTRYERFGQRNWSDFFFFHNEQTRRDSSSNRFISTYVISNVTVNCYRGYAILSTIFYLRANHRRCWLRIAMCLSINIYRFYIFDACLQQMESLRRRLYCMIYGSLYSHHSSFWRWWIVVP